MSRRSSQTPTPLHDVDLEHKVKKTTSKICENLHIIANEPSLAFYRLQEHTRKALPVMTEKRLEYKQLTLNLQGRCYDTEYGINAVKSIHNGKDPLKNILECLKNSMFLKQQIMYEENRRVEKRPSSMYQRSSASFDIPSIIPNTLNSITSAAGRLASSPVSVGNLQWIRTGSVSSLNSGPSNLPQTMSIPHLTTSAVANNAPENNDHIRSASLRENRHSTHGIP